MSLKEGVAWERLIADVAVMLVASMVDEMFGE